MSLINHIHLEANSFKNRVSKGTTSNPGDAKYQCPIKGQTSAGPTFDHKSVNAIDAWTLPYFSLTKLFLFSNWIAYVVVWSF